MWRKLDAIRRWESASTQLDRSYPGFAAPRGETRAATMSVAVPIERRNLHVEFRRKAARNSTLPGAARSETNKSFAAVPNSAPPRNTVLATRRIHRDGFRDRPDFCAGASPYFSNSNCNACRKSRLCGMSVCSDSALSFSAVSTGT